MEDTSSIYHEIIRDYITRGFSPVPIPYNTKAPKIVVVYPRRDGGGQAWRLTHRETGKTQFSSLSYETEVAAKLVALM